MSFKLPLCWVTYARIHTAMYVPACRGGLYPHICNTMSYKYGVWDRPLGQVPVVVSCTTEQYHVATGQYHWHNIIIIGNIIALVVPFIYVIGTIQCGFVLVIPLMQTFDPQTKRKMSHALRVIDTFLGNYTLKQQISAWDLIMRIMRVECWSHKFVPHKFISRHMLLCTKR